MDKSMYSVDLHCTKLRNGGLELIDTMHLLEQMDLGQYNSSNSWIQRIYIVSKQKLMDWSELMQCTW